jgi:hypothetical protein
MKTVFISYSHDSVEHRERVLALSERLRKDGIVLTFGEPSAPQAARVDISRIINV